MVNSPQRGGAVGSGSQRTLPNLRLSARAVRLKVRSIQRFHDDLEKQVLQTHREPLTEFPGAAEDALLARYPAIGTHTVQVGTQVNVPPGQELVVFAKGEALDVLSAGPQTLAPDNLPLTSEAFGFGSQNTPIAFDAALVWVNTRTLTGRGWGTLNPILHLDEQLGPLPIRAHGSYAVQVVDSRLFVNVLHRQHGLHTPEGADNQMREVITARLQAVLEHLIGSTNNVVAAVDALESELEAALQEDFGRYGARLKLMTLKRVVLPERIREREAAGAAKNRGQIEWLVDSPVQPILNRVRIKQTAEKRAEPNAADATRAAEGACAGCDQTVPTGARFCPWCGAQVEVAS